MNLKALLFSGLLLCVANATAIADYITYEMSGVVTIERTSGPFVVGRPYTFTFTIDTATPKTVAVPERGDFPNAITSFIFNYDSGGYIASSSLRGSLSILNDERGLYDHLFVSVPGAFPPVDGETFSTFLLFLTDTSKVAFASTDLPVLPGASAFQLQHFELSWGIDFNTRMVQLSVESLRPISRRPEIVSATRGRGNLTLDIALPDVPSTNVLERTSRLTTPPEWEAVATFITAGGGTNWTLPIDPMLPAQFFRMRPR